MHRSALSVFLTAVVASGALDARADTTGARPGEALTPIRVDAAVLPTRSGMAWVEQVEVMSTASQWVWLRPFPSSPEVTAGPDVLGTLAAHAVAGLPMSEQLERRLLGPSLVQALWFRWFPPEPGLAPLAPPSAPALTVEEVRQFSGSAQTSTVTGAVTLPTELEQLLVRYDTPLGPKARAELAHYLRIGWTLVALAGRDAPSPTPSRRILGPVRFDQAGERSPSYLLLSRRPVDGPLVIRALGPTPLVPAQLPTRYDPTVDPVEVEPGVAVVRSTTPIDNDVELAYRLGEVLDLPVNAETRVTELVVRGDGARVDELELVAPEDAVSRPVLPPPSRPGSGGDLFRCVLLGLSPLILAPESWLLYALQARARARARRGQPAFGVKAWSMWTLATAAYWLFALDGLARIAAVGPLLIGMSLLALPYTERDRGPVRARLPKRRRADATEGTAADA